MRETNGTEMRMIHVSDVESSVFSEAYFVLRKKRFAHPIADMTAEARRIIREFSKDGALRHSLAPDSIYRETRLPTERADRAERGKSGRDSEPKRKDRRFLAGFFSGVAASAAALALTAIALR